MKEYIVTARVEVPVLADTPEEADLKTVDYLTDIVCIREVAILEGTIASEALAALDAGE